MVEKKTIIVALQILGLGWQLNNIEQKLFLANSKLRSKLHAEPFGVRTLCHGGQQDTLDMTSESNVIDIYCVFEICVKD